MRVILEFDALLIDSARHSQRQEYRRRHAHLNVARRLGLQWGVHAVHTRDVSNFEEMVGKAKRMTLRHHLADAGDRVVIMAGVPFKTSGSTNVIHVVKIVGDELDGHADG